MIEPLRLLDHEPTMTAFAEQASALADEGVDLLMLETIFTVKESHLGRKGESRAPQSHPLVLSFSFEHGNHGR